MKLVKAIIRAGSTRFPNLYSEWCELNEFLDSYLNMPLPSSITQLFPTCQPEIEIKNLEIRKTTIS